MLWLSRQGIALLLLCCPLILISENVHSLNRVLSKAQPITPLSTDAHYRHIVLPNALAVTLISHPQSDKAAVAMAVDVGSGDDPVHREGLAHFLEHMLFLGTEKYPDAGEYQKFLSSHGGSFNAYTSFGLTNYFFSIQPNSLTEAIERFSGFFINPLLNAEYVQREREAVDAEYHAGMGNNSRRLLDVIKTQINPKHPYSRFHVGSLVSLSGADLHKELQSFYTYHYKANKMKLVLMGPQNLDELQNLVARFFSDVPSGAAVRQDLVMPLFKPKNLAKRITAQPKGEKRSLSLIFPIADTLPHYKNKPMTYIGHIIGHEGKGSLLAILKKRNWANALVAGRGFNYKGGATFNIDISLSKAGILRVNEIVGMVFDIVEMIMNEKPALWRFQELQALGNINFDYAERASPLSHVLRIAENMHLYAIEDILRGPYYFSDFDAPLIEDFLSYLRIDNMLVVVEDPELRSRSLSPKYGVPYEVITIPGVQLEEWGIVEDIAKDFSLPDANPFVPNNLKVLERKDKGDGTKVPDMLLDEPRLKLWHYQDQKFELPKADVRLRLDFRGYSDLPRAKALAQLWSASVEDMLGEYYYPAQLAGLFFNVGAHYSGIELALSGFDDKQQIFWSEVAAKIQQFKPGAERFRRIRDALVDALDNSHNDVPYRVMHRRLQQLININGSTEESIAKAMAKINYKDLLAYDASLGKKLHGQMLVHGNYSAKQALRLAKIVQPLFSEADTRLIERKVLHLPRTTSATSITWQESLSHEDKAVVLYLQSEDSSWRNRALVALSRDILQADFYRELRTERQLGYIVFMSSALWGKLPALLWTVQSPDASIESLEQEVRSFIDRSVRTAMHLPQPTFKQYQESLIARLEERDKNLGDATARWWKALFLSEYKFDSRKQLVMALSAISRDEWVAFYTLWVQEADRRELLLYASPNNDSFGKDKIFSDISQFHKEVAKEKDASWISRTLWP